MLIGRARRVAPLMPGRPRAAAPHDSESEVNVNGTVVGTETNNPPDRLTYDLDLTVDTRRGRYSSDLQTDAKQNLRSRREQAPVVA